MLPPATRVGFFFTSPCRPYSARQGYVASRAALMDHQIQHDNSKNGLGKFSVQWTQDRLASVYYDLNCDFIVLPQTSNTRISVYKPEWHFYGAFLIAILL